MSGRLAEAAYDRLTGDQNETALNELSPGIREAQPRNFLIHVAALAATKAGDGLADPKLVLPWLLNALGAPAYLIGFLVPVREAGALLPQLAVSAFMHRLRVRKWLWSGGSIVQGLMVAGMAVAVLTLDGVVAGWTVVLLLALFSLARSVCSVAYKDVLGRTVARATRGTATGTANTVAAALVLVYGTLLSFGLLDRTLAVVGGALFVAAGFWLLAGILFAGLREEATEPEGDERPSPFRQIALLREAPELRDFIIARGLLMATALAPPYLLSLSGGGEAREFGRLGLFVVAAGLAAVVSTYAWGRFSDTSSRKVLATAGFVAASALAGVALFDGFTASSGLAGSVYPIFLFILMIAHHGVRIGRSTHVVDMAPDAKRAAYTALSNTAIGLLLAIGGGFGVIAELAGARTVIWLFAAMATAGGLYALRLDEVQRR
ncbi:hypothetical protein [Oceanibacterium hippocampi]|uniref:Major Facilitator Superfamily protein n=1 Tax=Oceanibacterium hippocampi TaxID=745714 RepID=A0A1Y5TCC4_9PROT|nr:hypothetical protein [Oceanibacterium hippocampi]SLN60716.1 Major Facilitator Superfamily protein [Oceanibacterium hippocampi]